MAPNLADNLAEEEEERPLFVFRRFRGCSTFLLFLFGQRQQRQQQQQRRRLKIKTLNKGLNQKCVEVKLKPTTTTPPPPTTTATTISRTTLTHILQTMNVRCSINCN